MLKISCPYCGKSLKGKDDLAGRIVICPACKTDFKIPSPAMPVEALVMKNFDLNIDKILEDWDLSDAIRELIANAIDESILTNTQPAEVYKDDSGCWHVRDFGRGLRYQDLIQSENPEKIENPSVIGKFGIGLKDALATFDRNGIKVQVKSRHGDIILSRVSKHSFEDVVTLHATVLPPSFPDLSGTDCCLPAIDDSHVFAAKQMFLRFTGSIAVEETTFGAVHPRKTTGGVIYVNGMKVAEEPNFLFSYSITTLNSAIKRALNRERRNVGRTAYADRVRSILLSCKSRKVAEYLTHDLREHSDGSAHDELNWLDIQEHAARVLNAEKKVIFLSSSQLSEHPEIVDHAKSTGYEIVAVPERLTKKMEGIYDISGHPVREIHEFVNEINESFQYSWVLPKDLTSAEQKIWSQVGRILQLIGGRPDLVHDIRISETMRCDPLSIGEAGVWLEIDGWIVVKRTALRSLAVFAGVLLHEAIHAKTALTDVSREFETYLTNLIGDLAANVLNHSKAGSFQEASQTAHSDDVAPGSHGCALPSGSVSHHPALSQSGKDLRENIKRSLLLSIAEIWKNTESLTNLIPFERVFTGGRLNIFPHVSMVTIAPQFDDKTHQSISPLSFHIWVDDAQLALGKEVERAITDTYSGRSWQLGDAYKVIDMLDEGPGIEHPPNTIFTRWEIVKMFTICLEAHARKGEK
jgi:hypothetical protein